MEQYYELALLLFGFAVFVGAWIYVEKYFKNRKASVEITSSDTRIIRSQNSFLVFYGVKIELDPDNYDEHEACSNRTDPRCVSADSANLQTFSDRLTDGEDYFLYIGQQLGLLGLNHQDYDNIETDELESCLSSVQEKLKSLGYSERPSLHLQSIYEY